MAIGHEVQDACCEQNLLTRSPYSYYSLVFVSISTTNKRESDKAFMHRAINIIGNMWLGAVAGAVRFSVWSYIVFILKNQGKHM